MKYMMSCRQTLVELLKADEIRMDYKDIDRIRDFITEDWICSADIVIYIPKDNEYFIDWDMLKSYQEVLNIIIAIEDAHFSPKVKLKGFPWFWSYPVSSFWELQGILALGACQVLIDAPIFFELPQVHEICQQHQAEVRVIANQGYNSYMPRSENSGVYGVYIRPEDIPYYEPYVQHIEFESENLKQEQAYIRIYKEQQEWPGNLKILIPKLGVDVNNKGYDATFGKRRLSCRQRCQKTNMCKYCYSQAVLINTIQKNKDWIEKQLN